MPHSLPSVLVVCTGNICRSPMAEAMLRALAVGPDGRPTLDLSSAGTHGWDASPATESSARAAAERGLDLAGHRSRPLTGDLVEGADLMIAMSVEHRDAIASAVPSAVDRTFTLKELVLLLEAVRPTGDLAARVAAAARHRRDVGAPVGDLDVADPYGSSPEVYRSMADELDHWTGLLAQLLDVGSRRAVEAS